jgi:hypothetical protein
VARQVNEDVTRLPKWAQDRIKGLERETENLRAHIEELSTNEVPGTNTAIDQHHVYPDVDLPEFSSLLFYLGSGRDRWHDAVEVRILRSHPDRLEIRGTDSGLRIIPSSYNGVRIELDR